MTVFICSWIVVLTISVVLVTAPKRRRLTPRRIQSREYRRIRTALTNMRRSPYLERGPQYNPLPRSRQDYR